MNTNIKKNCIVKERKLSLDEALEYITATGARKEELEAKLKR